MCPVLDRAAELTGKPLRRRPRRRRPPPGRRRPRPQLADADRRRRHARQRGPRLRPAPADAPGGPHDAAARRTRTRRCPSCSRSAATRWASLPRARTRDWDRISQVAYAEEEAFRQTLRAGHDDLRPGRRRTKARGRHGCSAASAFALHDTYGFPIDLTLEMAAEQGLAGRRGRLPRADERAARPGQGRRASQEERARRRRGLPRGRSTRSARPVEFTGYDEVVTEGARPRPARDGERRRLGARGRRRSSSCSTARRSTPRAAASSPTRA